MSTEALPAEPREAPIVSSLGTEPWNEAWWKAAKGDRITFAYMVGIHVLALVGVVFFPQPSWKVFAATAVIFSSSWSIPISCCVNSTIY